MCFCLHVIALGLKSSVSIGGTLSVSSSSPSSLSSGLEKGLNHDVQLYAGVTIKMIKTRPTKFLDSIFGIEIGENLYDGNSLTTVDGLLSL